jgi:MOSC domain-containing protein YiiM
LAKILSIHITPTETQPLISVSEVCAVAGKGLKGDRYFFKTGTFSNRATDGREITLIESESLEALLQDYTIALRPEQTRRNLVTQGISLNHLVHKDFFVGEVLLRGIRLCEPCGHLEKLTSDGVRAGLIHRGGLRANILTDGIIRIGDNLVVK